jgi:hypothetical protein
LDNILNAGPAYVPEPEESLEELHLAASDEPKSFRDADEHACWRQAMRDEMDSITENDTWELATLPAGHRPIGLKWIFKVKRDEKGVVQKHKARLVAKVFMQRHGIDYDKVYAPVAHLESVRLILAFAGHSGWPVHHMDVKTVFLDGELDDEVYVSQLPGFEAPDSSGKVLRLRKALYGLN